MAVSLVYLTTRAPSKLADDLMLAGYRVFEALEVSEVLHLCETEWIDVVAIDTGVKDPDVIEAQKRRITMRLKSEATANDVIWELTQLFHRQVVRSPAHLVLDFGLRKVRQAMPREIRTRAEWSFACLKGTLASYLRPSSIRKVTLQQFDALRRCVQTSYGVSEENIKEAIASCIDALPNCDSERAEEIRRKYLH